MQMTFVREENEEMSEEYIWRINDDGTDAKIQKVVRCKDCKHGIPDREDGKIVGYECDLFYDSYWDADDFCSRGEKRDDNEDKN